MESTTQRNHKRGNAGSTGESLQRQRVGSSQQNRLEHNRNKTQKNKIKRNAKGRKGEKK